MRFTFLLLLICALFPAQVKRFVLIDVQDSRRYLKKDSISAVKFLDSLSQNNYFFTQLKAVKQNQNSTEIYFDKGKNFNEGWVTVSDTIAEDLKLPREFYFKNLDSLRRSINQKYIQKGYSFSRIKTKYDGLKNGTPSVKISVFLPKKEKLTGLLSKAMTSFRRDL